MCRCAWGKRPRKSLQRMDMTARGCVTLGRRDLSVGEKAPPGLTSSDACRKLGAGGWGLGAGGWGLIVSFANETVSRPRSSLLLHGSGFIAAARATAAAGRRSRDRRDRRRRVPDRDPSELEQRAGDVRARIRRCRYGALERRFAGRETGALAIPVARLRVRRVEVPNGRLGGERSDRRHRGASPLFREEARDPVGDLHHGTLDGRSHHHRHDRAARRRLPGCAADVRTAWRGDRLFQQRHLRHARDLRGAVSGDDRLAVPRRVPRPVRRSARRSRPSLRRPRGMRSDSRARCRRCRSCCRSFKGSSRS